MIARSTVLVLGAGASHPYGLPLGQGLTHDVCTELLNASSQQHRALQEVGFAPDLINEFVNDLRYSGFSSVDAFLETRNDFMPIGKAAIAASLIPRESPDHLFPPQARYGNWYQHLAGHLSIESDEFIKNKLSIITFNYDRSFEQYLQSVIKTRRRCSNREAFSILSKLPIIHVHGLLGTLDEDSDSYRKYSTELNAQTLATASSNIVIISEARDDTAEFNAARKVLSTAERIYFLGFGYAKQNVTRLGFKGTSGSGVLGFGTAQGLGPYQITEVKALFDPSFSFTGHDCLNLFTHEAPLESEVK
jgi:hypothetical protein